MTSYNSAVKFFSNDSQACQTLKEKTDSDC